MGDLKGVTASGRVTDSKFHIGAVGQFESRRFAFLVLFLGICEHFFWRNYATFSALYFELLSSKDLRSTSVCADGFWFHAL